MVSAAQAKQQDTAFEGDLYAVMERAGFAVANRAAAWGAGYGTRVAVLAGAGNNGGDGYCAARYLSRRGAAVKVYALAAPTTAEAEAAERAWRAAGGAVAPIGSPAPADLIIDAVFGVGFHGELPPAVGAWSAHVAPKLAVDVPSGLDGTTGVAAAGTMAAVSTVALSNYKTGHFLADGPELCGELALADLGLPEAEPSLLLCEEADAPRPARPRSAHKWSVGSVAVIGGSEGMAGAAILAATAALRFGAGAVAAFVPRSLAAELDAAHPEIMTHGIGSGATFHGVDPREIAAAAARFDVLIVGPGLGRDVGECVAGLLAATEQPIVLDADGLNAISVDDLAARPAGTVLTPHAGEFRRLTGLTAGFAAAADTARTTGATVLLKGPATIVASGEETPWLVTSGGKELATVGTGDVLAGMIAGLWARGLDGPTAARSAAYWHGEAGAALAATSTVTAAGLADAVRRFAF